MYLFVFAAALFTLPAGSSVSTDGTQFVPVEQWQNPGVASPRHPLQIWVRVPYGAALNAQDWYFVASDDVGRGRLWWLPYGARTPAHQDFGMRVPFDRRPIARIPPTVRVPNVAPGQPLYLELSLDSESRVEPILRLVDGGQLAAEDASNARLTSIALLFIGSLLSLAIAAMFVYYFMREAAYVAFAAWSVSSAVFASVYLHPIAWQWFWPAASLPAPAAVPLALLMLGTFTLLFARLFLDSRHLVPRVDRIVTWGCASALAVSSFLAIFAPSAHLGPFIGREALIPSVFACGILTLWLGIAAWRAGSGAARFFTGAFLVLAIASMIAAASNLFRYATGPHGDFVALMAGLALQGWLFFGALAYRLREAFARYMQEQQQRLVAQAESLAQARALVEERQISTTDQLTGLANRRAFDETLLREWDRCARAGAPLSLLILDVDHFKLFNDRYGHVAGDRTLRQVAEAIGRSAMRPGDRACRYGGEEFAAILPETDEEGACAVAASICQAVRELGIPHEDAVAGRVTISAGVATLLPEPGATPNIVEIADAALYEAKNEGRNRFAVAAKVPSRFPSS